MRAIYDIPFRNRPRTNAVIHGTIVFVAILGALTVMEIANPPHNPCDNYPLPELCEWGRR